MKIDPEKFALAVVMSDTNEKSLDVKLNLYRYAYDKAVELEKECANKAK
ncbi:MAG: hypothetical protein ABF756_00105 [Liquorilactobacillus ghanensis]